MNPDNDRRVRLDVRKLWLPADLVAVIGLTVLAVSFAVLPGIQDSVFRVAFGLLVLFFVSGYALVAAVFPEAGEPPGDTEWREAERDERRLDLIERFVLSCGLSITIVPLLGFVLSLSPWEPEVLPVLASLGGFTVLCACIGIVRRWRLPPRERFSIPYREWFGPIRSRTADCRHRRDVLYIARNVAIVLAVGTIAYAIVSPRQDERFTTLSILSGDENGELVGTNYSAEFVQGEVRSLTVGIDNHEQETVEYSIVVQLQRVDTSGDEAAVIEREELDRSRVVLTHDESRRYERGVEPSMTGEGLRLVVLLYVDSPPRDPTIENAHQTVHLWIDVKGSDE